MKVIRTIKEIRQQTSQWRAEGLKIGVVPTMGYLHEGHLELMRCAVEKCDRVVGTIFVNPLQFGPNEDLDAYPRDFERDRELAEKAGVDVLFCPEVADMYGEQFQTNISVQKVSQGLCGADRPGHFDGVATVVTKLFNMTQPHVAVFGRKDFQQLCLIKQLVEDLSFDIEIIGHPIVREPDGLAMSSRNKYLDEEGRKVATCLYKSIVEAKALYKENQGKVDSEEIIRLAKTNIEANPQCRVEYVAVVDERTLQNVSVTNEYSAIVLAMKVNGKVRLIDNSSLYQ